MPKRQNVVAIVLLLAMFVAIPAAALAQSANLTKEQLQSISANCGNIKVALQQLDKSETVARINRGRDYDQMLAQVAAFGKRLAYNHISQPQFGQLADDLQVSVDQFRSDFTTYENQLGNTAQSDCKNKPADFYDMLAKTRDERAAVSNQVGTIVDLMAEYRAAMVTYQSSLPPDSGASQ